MSLISDDSESGGLDQEIAALKEHGKAFYETCC